MAEEEVELIDYLRVIAKRRLIILGTLNVVIAGIVGLMAFLMLAFFLEYLDQVKRRETEANQ